MATISVHSPSFFLYSIVNPVSDAVSSEYNFQVILPFDNTSKVKGISKSFSYSLLL